MKKIEAIFFDRDGTLGGTGHFIHPSAFELYDNAREMLKMLSGLEVLKFGFTNQHRISRGEVTAEDFYQEFDAYGFDKGYVCPHSMKDDSCQCKKPKPGMLLQAAQTYHLDLKNCVVIGDVGTDMLAADRVGAIKILVKTGWGEASLTTYRETWEAVEPDYVAEDVLDAVQWLSLHYRL